ncbi:hypothetical protein AGABI1DRAFT_95888 [Agaricus bisporus var. burnettii JB137-S8]|uniref:RNase H type-1 domain-containing protein n=1 Tax=Agaricus bisporus var. burnettii (strain JB137-S8 / ATCC MYA-4627 / FGSC 10392) TaxID=597362 RepID=K5WU75_AGABU|nr:uncharacterized protein AGABI1DRAFT_95888 [Agaricus bisporus var. burnettii JB137-S8]EKM74077.1 hypothetical protein AGABI1DRAFT_95888 [Agaricus bisporus var. burnettii JB137-S8]
MVCSLFVRRTNHYDLDGITTIRGLILFLQDNPQAFSFEPPELPRHADESWPAYRKELELARDEENKRRKKKRLPPLTGPIFLHESIEFTRHWNVWEMDEGWGDIFRAMERGTKPLSQARSSTPSLNTSNLDIGIQTKSNSLSCLRIAKTRDEYHNNLNLAPVREPTALHLFTAGVKHKFDPSVPIPHQTHSHIALVTAFKGRAVTSKTRAAGRRVNEETIVGWSTFLALIKAHKKLQKGWPISKVVLYTTSQLIVKNLMSTNSKPLGSQLSIAVSLAFDAIATDFPEVDIEVRGFNKSWATALGFYTEDSGMLQPLAQRAYHEAETARTFTKRSLSFPQSASYHYTRQKTTRDAIQLWQISFQGVCTPNEPPPHMPSSDGIGTRQGPSVRSQRQSSPYHIKTCFKGNSWYEITDKEGNEVLPSHIQGGPWFQTYQGVKAANNSPLFARLMRVMCNHALIGEYRVRFFPNKPYKACQCDLKSPETRRNTYSWC